MLVEWAAPVYYTMESIHYTVGSVYYKVYNRYNRLQGIAGDTDRQLQLF